ncbi:MAG: MFS transporter [bacterium]|nr:MFS transporter [bacterium]
MHRHGHRHHLHFLQRRELSELYATVAIRAFALSMIGVFIPLFLLERGVSIPVIFLFYALVHGLKALLTIPAAHLAARFGFKHVILWSTPFTILFLLMLRVVEVTSGMLWIVALPFAVATALYWTGYHIDFITFSDRAHRGREIGGAQVAAALFQTLGPLAGGLIAARVGFPPLFIIVSILLLVATVPLFASRDVHERLPFKIRDCFRAWTPRMVLGLMVFGIEIGIDGIVWPIIIFTAILHSFEGVGLVSSLTFLTSTVAILIVGRMSDGGKGRVMLRVGSGMNALIWLVRAIAQTPLVVFITDMLYGISWTMADVPFDKEVYDRAPRHAIVPYVVGHQLFEHGALAAALVLFAVLEVRAGLFTGVIGAFIHVVL